jgi:hypothetical protein
VTAVDRDSGNNSAIHYSIVEGRHAFDVDGVSGEIFVNSSLSGLEQNVQYRLIVEAQDKGWRRVRAVYLK